ncbi:MAG: EAL domain-containing protein [Sphingomonadales bacterium]|nr:EAL domain-containing protein [Sphingomonadales bacterium]
MSLWARKAKSARSIATGGTAFSRCDILDQVEAVGAGAFWATDEEGRLAYLSTGALDALGGNEESLIGRPLIEIFTGVHEESGEEAQRTLGFQLRSRSRFENLIVRVDVAGHGDGSPGRTRWWRVSGKPYIDQKGCFQGYRGSSIDITAEYGRQLEAAEHSQYDPLTGLANRRRMASRLSMQLSACKVAGRSCALIMLDLDRFKQVNDTLGHPAGDELLKQVAERLKTVIKDRGEIGRLGGDEFQVILPDIDDRGDLTDLSARIIQMISQPYSINGKRAIVGTSVGVAIAPYDGIESDELNAAVDLALYAAKGSGRGLCRFYTADLRESAEQDSRIEEDLRDALVKGEMQMHYQPLVSPQDHTVRGFEALMRWVRAESGPVSPAKFIPIAEQTDLIVQLGSWALRQACEDAVQWPGQLRVAVNVSAKQFMNADFPKIVASALSSSGLEPDRLDLEITESVFVGEVEAVDKTFAQLKRLGVRLAMDDFGTGYSSLGYLNRAPFDKIKIDQTFVHGCSAGGTTNPAIISAIVALAKALGMKTVAEGVEAMDELALVTERGADLVQGYIYSRPLTHDAIMERSGTESFVFPPSGPPRYRADRMNYFRKIGVIHEDHYYKAMLRNLSKTGARIEGLAGVEQGTALILDLGGGQLAVSKVVRAEETAQGLKFETALIGDGNDGLMTRHRISPYALATAGMPLAALPPGSYPLAEQMSGSNSPRKFFEVDVDRKSRF